MQLLLLGTAWLAALAVPALAALDGRGWSLAPAWLVGWVALVWIALGSSPPLEPGDAHSSAPVHPAVCFAAALPSFALAAAIDLGGERSELAVGLSTACALALFALALVARTRLADSARSRTPYALVWLALVAGAPLATAALGWGAQARGAHAPAWLALVARASPLDWAFRLAAGEFEQPAWSGLPLGAFAVVVLLLVLAGLPRESAPR